MCKGLDQHLCKSAHNFLTRHAFTQVALMAALCTPMVPMLIFSWLAVVVAAASRSDLCWCWSWPLHFAFWTFNTGGVSVNWGKYPTSTYGGCHLLQLAACRGTGSLSHWHKYLHTWWYHPLQYVLVVFFLPTTGAYNTLALKQLALCGGGLWLVLRSQPAIVMPCIRKWCGLNT